MLSDEELKGIAAQALNMAKHDMELGQFNFLLAVYNAGDTPPLFRMKKIEARIIEVLGEGWLDSGRAKDIGFSLIRKCVELKPPDGVVYVTICNGFSPTEKLRRLNPAEQKKLVDAGHDRHHQAVAEGLLTVADILTAIVQTPERVCLYHQKLDKRGRLAGQPEVACFPQEQYDGRTKMFGKHYDYDALSQ